MVVGVCFLVPVRLNCVVVYAARHTNDRIVGYLCGGRFDRKLSRSGARSVHNRLDTRLQDCASRHRHHCWIIRKWFTCLFVWVEENQCTLRLLEQILRDLRGYSPIAYILCLYVALNWKCRASGQRAQIADTGLLAREWQAERY